MIFFGLKILIYDKLRIKVMKQKKLIAIFELFN
jgi:hypothetical protein